MTLRVYNTLTRTKEEFVPVTPGKVGMYVCGPTVYANSHIGHMVGPVIFDAIKRYLVFLGYNVTFVINITDIDDKIIVQANKEGCKYDALAERVTADYLENLRRLKVQVDHFPRATHYISKMHAMIAGLIEKGFAYAVAGDVYFDVTRDADYGKLSNRKIEELLAGVRKEVNDVKRNPGDFALWKGAKPGEPAWESPWGPGRPGWHIECSVMAMNLLGETFDIHGGGLDLCFPHHEDEIAQSESFSGKTFAKYWLHNGLMQKSDETRKLGATANRAATEGDFASQEQEKMSKSKGNVITITELLSRFPPETIRFFLLSTHYRRPIDFSDERINEVAKGLARFQSFVERSQRILGSKFADLPAPAQRAAISTTFVEGLAKVGELRERFFAHMDDDFNTGGAIGVLFELLPMLNKFADDHRLDDPSASADKKQAFQSALLVLRELANVLGVVFEPSPLAKEVGDTLTPKLLDLLLEVRQMARKSKNFALSDTVRDRLKELGVTVEDRPEGSTWKRT